MPKRVVDGDRIWDSDKLRNLRESWMKPEYANLLPLALANGTFEADPRRVWSKVYSYNRQEVTVEQVGQLLDELERVRMLFRWNDGTTGKQWGYFVGIDKPGRLPPASRVRSGHEILGPTPPMLMVEQFLRESLTAGEPVASQTVLDGSLGFGSGIGFGSGSGLGMGAPEPEPLSRVETAVIVAQECHLSGKHFIEAIVGQLLTYSLGNPLRVAAEKMIEKTLRFKELGGKEVYFWLCDGGWCRDESTWKIPGRTGSKQQERARHNYESLVRSSAAFDAAGAVPDSTEREGGTGRPSEPRVLEGVRKATTGGD